MPERVTRGKFIHALDELNQGVLTLGSMVDKAIARAMQALAQRNLDLAREVIENDQTLNRRRFELENIALDVLARQQPMAGDLRFIMATQIIAIELERMGDYARGIAEVTLRMSTCPSPRSLDDLMRMSDLARAMLSDALDAFAQRDAALARSLAARDDAVDALNDRIYAAQVDVMTHDPQMVNCATWLLWITHNIERLADRVTNIAERVVFMVTGELVEMDVSTF